MNNKEASRKILTDAEALEEAFKFGKEFSLNPNKCKIRIDAKDVICPLCGKKGLQIDPLPVIRVNSSNTNHRAECEDCDSVITLWNVAIANNYYLL